MAMDHTNCTHPRTPAGRRACRSGNNLPADTGVNAVYNDFISDRARKAVMNSEIKMTGPVARRIARQAAKADMKRIQPRRSGARVSVTGSTCVQAALHIDAHGGRCACGWVAA